ncbi:hypothetical protein [Kineococcus sp. SYSU DK005]|uniref:hypothetical protein n=1 Tax=Kineococcus sp. SYSU DK005 TaxID=3383126 RepID=UPI003D7E7482
MTEQTPVPPGGAAAEERAVQRLADDLAAAAGAVPGVARLHPGALGEIGTYLPGRRVAGVRLRGQVLRGDGTVEVHVVLAAGAGVRETAADVHAAAARVLRAAGVHAPVAVHVQDVAA